MDTVLEGTVRAVWVSNCNAFSMSDVFQVVNGEPVKWTSIPDAVELGLYARVAILQYQLQPAFSFWSSHELSSLPLHGPLHFVPRGHLPQPSLRKWKESDELTIDHTVDEIFCH